MKKSIIHCLVLLPLFFSCGFDKKINNNNLTFQEKLDELQTYLAEGVILEAQRPMENVLSEQEVLLTAAEIAI